MLGQYIERPRFTLIPNASGCSTPAGPFGSQEAAQAALSATAGSTCFSDAQTPWQRLLGLHGLDAGVGAGAAANATAPAGFTLGRAIGREPGDNCFQNGHVITFVSIGGGGSFNRGKSSGVSQQFAVRELLTPDEVMRKSRAIVFVAGEPAWLLDRIAVCPERFGRCALRTGLTVPPLQDCRTGRCRRESL